MCTTCGCEGHPMVTFSGKGTGRVLSGLTIVAPTPPPPPPVQTVEARVLAKNDALAERNRAWLADQRILALNLMSAPGSGKTALLERTLRELGGDLAVVEGDQASDRDAERIRSTGTPVIQVNTGTGCHLEADMVWTALEALAPPPRATVFVENVGNLVCPALFDLGEAGRVVLLSTTEGDDKPLKYPHMFRAADVVLVTKIDLAPHVDFDRARAVDAIRTVNPDAPILEVSAKTGEGLGAWYAWIRERAELR